MNKITKPLYLPTGSILHYDLPRDRGKIWITCGLCKKQRLVHPVRPHRRNKNFTGYCLQCSELAPPQKHRKGKDHPNWKGGFLITKDGYKEIHFEYSIPDKHKDLIKPMLGYKNYVTEHRYIMAVSLNRSLKSNEVVHHLNGDRLDNRLCNLSLESPQSHPKAQKVRIDAYKNEIKRLQNILDKYKIEY